jgi:integrase
LDIDKPTGLEGMDEIYYSQIFKNFVGWLNENYGLKIKTKDWKVQKPKNSIMPEYLITEEEFNKLFNATDDIQERVLIGLLYESGSRIGEILSLQIKNVSFNNYGAKLIVKGETAKNHSIQIHNWYSLSCLLDKTILISYFSRS